MRLLTACGTGILVGTALIVIIPEGVETLYSVRAIDASTSHQLGARSTGTRGLHSWTTASDLDIDLKKREVNNLGWIAFRARAVDAVEVTATGLEKNGATPEGKVHGTQDQPLHKEGDHEFEPHAWVGISVIAGFVLMYLVDKLPKLASSPTRLKPAYISLGAMGLRGAQNSDEEGEGPTPETPISPTFRPSSTTTGLVIHAAADGIALGASSASSSQKLSMIIFLALMIHKAPAAFGLTAVLLKQGLSKREARAHLIVFSLAAPLGALATFMIAHLIGGRALDSGSRTTFVTSLLLLFSGGTFLYVAMHTMQDAGHEHGPDESKGGNGYADIYQQQQHQTSKDEEGPTLLDTLVTVGGMLLPLLLQFGHAH